VVISTPFCHLKMRSATRPPAHAHADKEKCARRTRGGAPIPCRVFRARARARRELARRLGGRTIRSTFALTCSGQLTRLSMAVLPCQATGPPAHREGGAQRSLPLHHAPMTGRTASRLAGSGPRPEARRLHHCSSSWQCGYQRRECRLPRRQICFSARPPPR
jgi:hypothetical protein